jgi:hypothetical protein
MDGLPGGGYRRRIERRETSRRATPRPYAQAAEAADETAEVARYIADMTAQLESMATAARLDLLGYFLAMARMEADAQARTPSNDSAEA